MSTGLELRQDLQRIQVSPIKIPALQSSTSSDDLIRPENGENDEGCRTPTSVEHKIPAVLCCPPAPRKPKRISSCKRKLSEFEFFDIVNRQEVESFFQSSFDQIVVSKRRRKRIEEKALGLGGLTAFVVSVLAAVVVIWLITSASPYEKKEG